MHASNARDVERCIAFAWLEYDVTAFFIFIFIFCFKIRHVRAECCKSVDIFPQPGKLLVDKEHVTLASLAV